MNIAFIGENACKLYSKYKILPSLTIAQAILESGWFKSKLSNYNNFFGMKWVSGCGCSYVSLPTKEWYGKKYVTINAKFRTYDSCMAGLEGYYKFLSYKRYKNLVGVTDYKEACKLIQRDGWATSPVYAELLIKTIEQNKLYEYDKKVLGKSTAKPSGVSSKTVTYTVKEGDTLGAIAKKYGATVEQIAKDNKITNINIIHVGDKLKIKK